MTKKSILLILLSLSLSSASCDTKTKNVAACGDGFLDPGEECDGAPAPETTCGSLGHYNVNGTLACNDDCTFDLSDCGGRCGDGVIETGFNEDCDGANLADDTCQTLGFIGGTLSCSETCQFDTTLCESTCGNGVVEEGEDCDGSELDGQDCVSLGLFGGQLACGSDCSFITAGCSSVSNCGNGVVEAAEGERCDGEDFDGDTCQAHGFYGGTLTCLAACREIDTTQCAGRCGDQILDTSAGETCDGTELGGGTCEGLGYRGGALACAADCLSYDVALCEGACGDDILDPGLGETCDGTDLGGLVCHSGFLSCLGSCQLDTSLCTAGYCGDGLIQGSFGEACDGTNLQGDTCSSLGYPDGTLVCTPDCGLEKIGCLSFTAITSGYYHNCALDTRGLAWCWGSNAHGQLGDNSTTDRHVPKKAAMPPGKTFTRIDAGSYHTCAIDTEGAAWCWGTNSDGQIGDGTTAYAFAPTPVVKPGSMTFVRIAAGHRHSCAIDNLGAAHCWGYNNDGQLGDGTTTSRVYATAALMPVGRTFTELSAGGASYLGGVNYSHTCAIDDLGKAWCWGVNNYGQLGDGTTTARTQPTAVSGMSGGFSFSQIHANCYGGCAIDGLSEGYCWGWNYYGQLGDGSTVSRSLRTPVTMPPGRTFTFMSIGERFTCAVDHLGDAWCWGFNNRGQLGDGNATSSLVPVAVTMPAGHEFTTISAGGGAESGEIYSHACALDTEGAAWCWGDNGWGQLGDDTVTQRSIPTRVAYPF